MNIRLIQTLFMPPPPPPRPPFLSVRTMGFDHTIKPCFTATRLIRTPRSYGHFFLMPPPPSMSVQTRFDHTVKPFFTDTPFIRTLFVNGPFSVSLLTGFDCRRDYMKFCTFGTTRYLWNTVKSRLLVNADTEVVIETVRND